MILFFTYLHFVATTYFLIIPSISFDVYTILLSIISGSIIIPSYYCIKVLFKNKFLPLRILSPIICLIPGLCLFVTKYTIIRNNITTYYFIMWYLQGISFSICITNTIFSLKYRYY